VEYVRGERDGSTRNHLDPAQLMALNTFSVYDASAGAWREAVAAWVYDASAAVWRPIVSMWVYDAVAGAWQGGAAAPAAAPSTPNALDNSSCRPDGFTPDYVVHLSWTNGDSSAYTEVYMNSVLQVTVNPGVASTDCFPGMEGPYSFKLRHVKMGNYSAYSGTRNVNIINPCGGPL
jgi:hypothetical protein